MPVDPLSMPIRATTQDHLDIEDILDSVVILKDGSCCLILSTTAVNFGLLSEKEQDATIYAYASLLNSLTFPIQLVISSKRKDVTFYIASLDREIEKQTNPLLQDQMRKYRKFIEDTIRKNNVLDKTFYIIIPFSALELGVTKTLGSMVKKKYTGLPYPKEFILERAKMNLLPKRDHIVRQFGRLGLKIRVVDTKEAVQLFFDIYNPESAGIQRLTDSREYSTPIVQPAVESSGKKEEATNG